MAVGFYLKSPSAQKSAILAIVRYCGVMYKRSTGISVEAKLWNRKTHSCRLVGEHSQAAQKINTRLAKLYDACAAVCMDMSANFELLEPQEYWQRVDSKLARKDVVLPSFTEYLEGFMERKRSKLKINTVKGYCTLLHKLRQYERHTRKPVTFDRINQKFYDSFRDFLLGQGYNLNSFGAMITRLKTVYREARDVDKMHKLYETDKKGFATFQESPQNIYLTQEELKAIADAEISPASIRACLPDFRNAGDEELNRHAEELDIVRKKFLIGAYTALRVSDYNQLSALNIDDRFIRVKTRKTGAAVVIPIHPEVRAILSSGFDVSTPVSDAKINMLIKDVARIAGITDVVEGTKRMNLHSVHGYFPKYEMVTSHTARRSAATNMYKAGIPAISIMKITGHTTERSFLKYIKISQEENAELLAENAFFRGE